MSAQPAPTAAQAPPKSQAPLDPYLDRPLRLFFADQALLKAVLQVLGRLGFSNLSAAKVHPLYFEAMRQLYGDMVNFEGLILANPPLVSKGQGEPTYESLGIKDFYEGLSALVQGNDKDAALLAKVVPVFVAAFDSAAQARVIQELMPYGILGAFMLRPQPPDMPKDVRLEERTQELYDYLLEYFREQDNKLGQFRDYRNADELARRKAEADRIMAEAQRLRELRDYDKAVALCRKAIEIYPADPEPYLEGGRLLVRKRKYTAALRMFRDAEQVAKNLPAPNQEIGKLRALQAQEYVASRRAAGKPVDRAKVDGLLAEAVESFEAALGKAEEVRAEEAGRQKAARQEATASVVEDILSLGLEEMLAPEDPRLQRLMGLAERGMAGQEPAGRRLAPRQLIQMGLMAFHRGDTAGAVKQLVQAAQDPESLAPACQKLNFIGTQLRRRGEVDQALKLYAKLAKLEPPFLGFVLFNLAVAQQAKALEVAEHSPAEAPAWEAESFASLVEALWLEPHLVKDPNFYHNTVMLPVAGRGRQAVEAAFRRVQAAGDPAEERCRRACQQVELLLLQQRRKEALKLLFLLARKLPAFFTGFSRYASEPVYRFAHGLAGVLARKPEPEMQKMGRILGLLQPPAPQSSRVGRDVGVPAVEPALKALSLGERRRAARELGAALYARPELAGEARLWREPALVELARELYARVSPVDVAAFQGQARARAGGRAA